MNSLLGHLSNFRAVLTWQLVRGVGELQILTRASYVMLAVVPLLAGVWLSVSSVINKYNGILEQKTQELSDINHKISIQADALSGTIQTLIQRSGENGEIHAASVAITNFSQEMNKFTARITSGLTEIQRSGILSPWLPSSWALAFLAALGVTLGQIVYQTQAPELVRKMTRDEHVRNKLVSFREHPYEEDFEAALADVRRHWWEMTPSWGLKEDTLEKAIAYFREKGYEETDDMSCVLDYLTHEIDDATFKITSVIKKEDKSKEATTIEPKYPLREVTQASIIGDILPIKLTISFLLFYDKIMLLESFASRVRDTINLITDRNKSSYIEQFSYVSQQLFDEDWKEISSLIQRAKADVVGEAAILEYNANLRRRLPMMILALFCYSAACIPIVILTIWQCSAVLRASGWID